MRKNDLVNLLALASIQGGNALLPIFLLPYLLAKLGADQFSQLATVEAVCFIVLTFSLYSFDVSGVKKVIDAKNEGQLQVAKVYFSILYARLIVFSFSALIAGLWISFFRHELLTQYLTWLMFPLGVVLQSSFYYQSLGANIPLAFFVCIPRIVSCVASVLLVSDFKDAGLASGLIASSYLASGLASLFYVTGNLGFVYLRKESRSAISLLIEGKALFLAGCSVILYRSSNTLILALAAASPEAISAYAVAEKYVRMLQALTLPLSQLFLVRTVKELRFITNKQELFLVLWKNTKIQLFISTVCILLVSIVGHLFRDVFSTWLGDLVIELTMLMAPAMAFGVANYMYGSVTLNALGRDRQYANIVFIVGLLTVSFSTVLIWFFSARGASVGYLFGEAFLLIIVIRTLHGVLR